MKMEDDIELRRLYAEFCQDILKWVQEGMPRENPHCFYKRAGLCSNLYDWVDQAQADALCDYQTRLFRDAGLAPNWPFDGNPEAYCTSKNGAGLYANEARLQWLRDHASTTMITDIQPVAKAVRRWVDVLTELMDHAYNDGCAGMATPSHATLTCLAHAIQLFTKQNNHKPVSGCVLRNGQPTLLQDKHILSTDTRLYITPQPPCDLKALAEDVADAAWDAAPVSAEPVNARLPEDQAFLAGVRALKDELLAATSIMLRPHIEGVCSVVERRFIAASEQAQPVPGEYYGIPLDDGLPTPSKLRG
jgi:hypothetical protein